MFSHHPIGILGTPAAVLPSTLGSSVPVRLASGFTSPNSCQAIPCDPFPPTDVVIQIEHRLFHAHQSVLAAHSGYFKSIFFGISSSSGTKTFLSATDSSSSDSSRLVNKNESGPSRGASSKLCVILTSIVTQSSFAILLEFMYTLRLCTDMQNVCEVMSCSQILGVPSAVELCRRFLARIRQNPFTPLNPHYHHSALGYYTGIQDTVQNIHPCVTISPHLDVVRDTSYPCPAMCTAAVHSYTTGLLPPSGLPAPPAKYPANSSSNTQPPPPLIVRPIPSKIPVESAFFIPYPSTSSEAVPPINISQANHKLCCPITSPNGRTSPDVSDEFPRRSSPSLSAQSIINVNNNETSSSSTRPESSSSSTSSLLIINPESQSFSEKQRSSPDSTETKEHAGSDWVESPDNSEQRQQQATPSRNPTNKAILDIACCDGPVKFQRVLNENCSLVIMLTTKEQEQTRPNDSDEISTTNDGNGSFKVYTQSFRLSLMQGRAVADVQDMRSSQNEKKVHVNGNMAPSPLKKRIWNTKPRLSAKKSRSSTYYCVYCRHSFKSLYCYAKHKRRHLNPVIVDGEEVKNTCEQMQCAEDTKVHKISETTDELQQKTTTSNKEGRKEAEVIVTKDASNSSSKPLDINVPFYPCKLCGCKFPSYYFVHKHRRIFHQKRETIETDSSNAVSDTDNNEISEVAEVDIKIDIPTSVATDPKDSQEHKK